MECGTKDTFRPRKMSMKRYFGLILFACLFFSVIYFGVIFTYNSMVYNSMFINSTTALLPQHIFRHSIDQRHSGSEPLVMENVCLERRNNITTMVIYNAPQNANGTIVTKGPLHYKTTWQVEYRKSSIPVNGYEKSPLAVFIKETFPGNWFHMNENTLISKY